MKLPDLYNCTIAVIGLGYVGLPLALEFSTRKKACLTNIELKRKVIGFDVNRLRIKELINKFDRTGEACEKQLKNADNIIFTHNKELIKTADVYIITVPTPINDNKEPDLKASKEASLLVGETLSLRNLILIQSLFMKVLFPQGSRISLFL